MRRLGFIFIFAAITGAALAGLTLKQSIDNSNKAVEKAMVAKDAKALDKAIRASVTSDFKYTESGRSMGADEMLKGMTQGITALGKIVKAPTTTKSISQNGNSATVKQLHSIVAETTDANKKTHVMDVSVESTETWKLVNGKWLMSLMSVTKTNMKVDGKAINAGGSAPH